MYVAETRESVIKYGDGVRKWSELPRLSAPPFFIEPPRWISVDERLPEPGETVLVWHHGEVQMAWLNHFTNGVAYFVRDTHYNFEPTHWMPLPAPPEVK